jgi:hypothetical protein
MHACIHTYIVVRAPSLTGKTETLRLEGDIYAKEENILTGRWREEDFPNDSSTCIYIHIHIHVHVT